MAAGFTTEITTLLYCPGITVIVPAATLPVGPGVTAVTSTVRSWQVILGRLRMATGRKSASDVANATSAGVRTSVPCGIV